MPTVLELIFWLAMVVAAITVCILIFGKTEPDLYLSKEALKDYQDKK